MLRTGRKVAQVRSRVNEAGALKAVRGPLEAQVATYTRNGLRGFVRLARAMAERFGEAAYDEIEDIFAAEGVTAEELRSGSCSEFRGWNWSD